MPTVGRSTLARLILTVVLFGPSLPARGDVVILTNRVQYTGKITSLDASQVTILSEGMEWSFARDKVATIKTDKRSADDEVARNMRRRAAAKADELRRASEEAEQPLHAGRGPPVVTPRPHHGASPAAARANDNGVVVYGTAWCGYCRKARAFFSSRGVPFADKNIEQDSAANDEMHRKCSAAGVQPRGVPVIDVFGELVLGYDERYISSILSRHGY